MTEVKHVGIIMDGNRRWAKEKGLKPWDGHSKGAELFEDLIEGAIELGLKEITLYTFSTENFKRSEPEKMMLFDLLKRKCLAILEGDKRIDDNGVKISFVGNLKLFPSDLQELMDKVMNKTSSNDKFKLNFAMGYGGRAEIINAANQILKEGKEVDEESFKKFLYLESEPEMIIRTGGAMRLSGFLTYQSVYSELIFVEKYWPDFTKADLKKCLDEFAERERRFGC